MGVGFIPCSGAMPREQGHGARSATVPPRSIWLRSERQPDASAIALYDEVWFSSDEVR
jgi:protein-L-isoaspartate(D-aspartate) O-methyltransferase